ncbi:hypothetical protein CARUB_v10007824mg, partial [Capsella rubella]
FIYVLSRWEGAAHDSRGSICGVRYHLQEFSGQGRHPDTPLRHASMRNVIKRIFGIFKSRFAKVNSVNGNLTLCPKWPALHKFLRRECRSDEGEFPDEVENKGLAKNNEGNTPMFNGIDGEEHVETQEQDRENTNIWIKSMAENMWKDAMNSEIQ